MSKHEPGSASFRTTRWTRVLAARGKSDTAKAALSELCEAYYEPVYAFVRFTAGEDSARDLTHAFFAGLLERGGFDSLERGRGKFRSYLLGAVKHFLADEHDRSNAEKRGSGRAPLSLDEDREDSPGKPKLEVESPAASDAVYDREWAIALLRRAIDQLAGEQRATGHGRQFEVLKPWLNGEATALSQAEAANELGVSQNALKVAIHRLRKRFRELVRDEIAQTVNSEEEIPAELNYLIEALQARS
jgi:RNA polymerase sigma-70 factor (ECF subfamily)